jgi:hypothetical protein
MRSMSTKYADTKEKTNQWNEPKEKKSERKKSRGKGKEGG